MHQTARRMHGDAPASQHARRFEFERCDGYPWGQPGTFSASHRTRPSDHFHLFQPIQCSGLQRKQTKLNITSEPAHGGNLLYASITPSASRSIMGRCRLGDIGPQIELITEQTHADMQAHEILFLVTALQRGS